MMFQNTFAKQKFNHKGSLTDRKIRYQIILLPSYVFIHNVTGRIGIFFLIFSKNKKFRIVFLEYQAARHPFFQYQLCSVLTYCKIT